MTDLIGYVSDEWDCAVPGARAEFSALADASVRVITAEPSGGLRGDLPPGEYRVIISAPGFGSKRTMITIDDGRPPARLRILGHGPYGYVGPGCAPAGTDVELFLHADGPFRLSLWRYGWEPEQVMDLGQFGDIPPGTNRQILPDGDVSASGCGWNYGSSGAPTQPRWHITAPERSGLYWFHLVTDSGLETSFPLVVSPAVPSAPIAVLASDITWCAYNDFGGRSNYIAPRRLPEAPSVNVRQENVWYPDPELGSWEHDEYDALSFDRPNRFNRMRRGVRITDPIVERGGEHLAPAEWRLFGWLEQQGFAFDLYGETQFHRGVFDLDSYRVLIISTHPEYWSRSMYLTLRAWVQERGGRLLYLGGNGINCEVVFDGDTRMVVRNGRSRELQEQAKNSLDGAWTTRFERDVESEAALLGVRHTWPGFETGAPYRVVDPDHWAFAGTGLKAGDVFGVRNLNSRCAPGGASGHETDKMGPESPPGTKLLAEGTNPGGGGAHFVHVQYPSGGEVVSVGSISYPTSLPVDPPTSRITANVLVHLLRP
jgi:N,N-dimethylformamidase